MFVFFCTVVEGAGAHWQYQTRITMTEQTGAVAFDSLPTEVGNLEFRIVSFSTKEVWLHDFREIYLE